MFGNFAKIGRAAGASPISQIFKTSCTSTIKPKLYELFVYYWHDKITDLNVKFFEALYPAFLEDNSQCQHRIFSLN